MIITYSATTNHGRLFQSVNWRSHHGSVEWNCFATQIHSIENESRSMLSCMEIPNGITHFHCLSLLIWWNKSAAVHHSIWTPIIIICEDNVIWSENESFAHLLQNSDRIFAFYSLGLFRRALWGRYATVKASRTPIFNIFRIEMWTCKQCVSRHMLCMLEWIIYIYLPIKRFININSNILHWAVCRHRAYSILKPFL